MRTIYFIRHGKPEFADGRKYCIGRTDLPLSEEGREQIRALVPRFAGQNIEKIYTSPLKRCLESAQILSGGRIPIEVAEGLAEIDMGEWDGRPFEDIRSDFPEEYAARGADMYRFRPPGGESFADCAKRAEKTWKEILASSQGNVILVGHAGWCRTRICGWEQKNKNELLKIPFEYAQVYERREACFDALISAAGRSSRMGDFKPLMNLGGQTVLEHEIQTLRNAGVREITIITGREAEKVKRAVDGPGIHFIHNPEYQTTEMFDSVCLGLRYYNEKRKKTGEACPDGIFFFPVDVPLFTEFTLKYEMYRFSAGDGDVYLPEYEETPGHPLLIRAEALPHLLKHDGTQGLKGACSQPGIRQIPLSVPDPGCARDADTQEEFEELRRWEKARPVPDEAMCMRLLSWFHTPDETIRHCQAVAGLARELAEKLQNVVMSGKYIKTGIDVDADREVETIYAAALLHDIAKTQPEHPETGARWLELLGHTGIAQMVADHMDVPEEKLNAPNGSLIVYLADKLVQGEKRVTLEERFAAKRERFWGNPEALAAVERRYQLARRALGQVENWLGEAIEIARTDGNPSLK